MSRPNETSQSKPPPCPSMPDGEFVLGSFLLRCSFYHYHYYTLFLPKRQGPLSSVHLRHSLALVDSAMLNATSRCLLHFVGMDMSTIMHRDLGSCGLMVFFVTTCCRRGMNSSPTRRRTSGPRRAMPLEPLSPWMMQTPRRPMTG